MRWIMDPFVVFDSQQVLPDRFALTLAAAMQLWQTRPAATVNSRRLLLGMPQAEHFWMIMSMTFFVVCRCCSRWSL